MNVASTPTGSFGTTSDAPAVTARESVLARAATRWLVAVVGMSTLLRASIGLGSPSPWILPDEILYSELAKAIAEGTEPAVRGVPALTWGVVYPVLVAPAWAAFADPVSAYHAALVINALVMSSAAIPAYLLARLFVAERSAIVVAAMTVLVPSLSYTSVVMTENAFYPVFMWSVFLIARAVRRPTVAGQLLALVGIGLLAATRIQGVVLVGAYLAAAALYGLTAANGERRAYLRRLVPTIVLVAAGSLSAFAVLAMRGGGGLGGRSGTFDGLRLFEVPEWLAYLAGGLVLYVALIPAAATVVVIVCGLRSQAEDPVRLFASVVLPIVASMLGLVALVSASIDVDGTENLNERYVFYVVPLLFLGLALWIRQGLPRNRWAWVGLGACTLLALLVPIERLEYNAAFQSVALLPWLELAESRLVLAAGLAVFLAATGVLWGRCVSGRTNHLWVVVSIWMAFVGAMAVGENANLGSFYARAFDSRPAAWVDRAVPKGETVAVLWRQPAASSAPEDIYYWLMITEMFNRSLGDVLRIGPPTYYESILPTVPARVRDGRLVRNGRSVDARYALVTCRDPVEGRVVAAAPYRALLLIEARRPLRLLSGSLCGAPRGS
jgi:hypothetical protein